jgi:hypothetical protein
MTIGKRAASVLLASAATAAVIGLGAAPALASTPPKLTVTVGSGGTFTATAKTSVLTDGKVSVTCSTKGKTAASDGTGAIKSPKGKGTAPVKVGTTAKLAFNNCTSIAGSVVTKVESLPYSVEVDSATNRKGDTDGIISGVKVAVTVPAVGCKFMVTGSAPGYYANGSHTLNVTSNLPTKSLVKAELTVSGVNANCLGLIHNGDHPGFVATYALSRKATIKSTG